MNYFRMKRLGFLICAFLTATVDGALLRQTTASSVGKKSTIREKVWGWGKAKMTDLTLWTFKKCPAYMAWLEEGDAWVNKSGTLPEDAIKFWTGLRVYYLDSNDTLENSLLRKNVLGPVAVMINYSLRRTMRSVLSIKTPVRIFSEAIMTVSKLLADDIKKIHDSEPIANFLGDGCSGFTLTGTKLEEQRKKYAHQLELQKGKAPFEAAPRAIVALSGWTRGQALEVGTLQVKCLALRLSDQKVKEPDSMFDIEKVKREIARYPEFLKTVLEAKIGLMEPLYQKVDSKVRPWKLKRPKIWKYESLDQLLDEVSSEVQQE